MTSTPGATVLGEAVLNAIVNASNVSGQQSDWPAHSYVATPPYTTTGASPAEGDDDGGVKMTTVKTAFNCGVVPALSVLGVAGNCLCVLVFLRQRYHSVAKPLLLALCVSNVLFLLCSFLVSLPCLVGRVDKERGRALHVHLVPQVDVFREVMSRVTVVLTLAMGVERSVAVTRPLKLRGLCTVPRTRTAVLAVFLTVFALQAPAFFRHDVRRHVTPDNVTTGTTISSSVELVHTSFYLDNRRILDIYFDYFLLAALRALPIVAIVVCFCIVLFFLKRRLQSACPKAVKFGAFARAKGKRSENQSETEHADLVLEERKLTRALLVVLWLCAVFELPALVTKVFGIVRPGVHSFPLSLACEVSVVLCVVNSAVSFVVFMVLYKNFAVTFKMLAGLCN